MNIHVAMRYQNERYHQATSGSNAALKRLGALNAREPGDSVLDEDLSSGLELGLVQGEVIHRSDPHDALPRPSFADTIHERAAV